METGIYVFENRVEHKAYIGQSSRLNKRIQEHYMKKRIYKDEFHKTLMTNPEYFIHSIVEYCSIEELNSAELKWMELYKANGWEMYNKMWRPIPNRRGKKLSEEHRKKLSEVNKGESNPNYGKHLETFKGKHHSEETKKKMSENNARYWAGKTLSEETKKKMSEAMKGIHKGKHLSEEHRKKLSEANKGKHWRLNPETGKREYY